MRTGFRGEMQKCVGKIFVFWYSDFVSTNIHPKMAITPLLRHVIDELRGTVAAQGKQNSILGGFLARIQLLQAKGRLDEAPHAAEKSCGTEQKGPAFKKLAFRTILRLRRPAGRRRTTFFARAKSNARKRGRSLRQQAAQFLAPASATAAAADGWLKRNSGTAKLICLRNSKYTNCIFSRVYSVFACFESFIVKSSGGSQ